MALIFMSIYWSMWNTAIDYNESIGDSTDYDSCGYGKNEFRRRM